MYGILKTDGRDFLLDSLEFRGAKWLNFGEAKNLVTDRSTLRALNMGRGQTNPLYYLEPKGWRVK